MMVWLFQTTIFWLVLAIFYHLLLRYETFFVLNRRYLLASLLGGMLLPVLLQGPLSQAVSGLLFENISLPDVSVNAWAPQNNAQMPIARLIEMCLCGIWAGGSLLYATRLLYGIGQIVALRRRAVVQHKSPTYQVLESPEIRQSFSFLSWVFVPADNACEPEVLAHELAHVHEYHTLDILLAELVCSLFWWHPLAHWHRKSLRAVHEYKADQMAVRSSTHQQYGLLLIRQAQSGPAIAAVHHFFQSPLKQRIVMLTKHHSAASRRWKYALVLPLLLFVIALVHPNPLTAQTTDKQAEVLEKPDQVATYPGGVNELMKFLGAEIKYPESARKAKIEGTVAIEFLIDTDGTVQNAHPLGTKPVDPALAQEALRVVIATKWIPAEHAGKKVKCRYVLPIKFKLD